MIVDVIFARASTDMATFALVIFFFIFIVQFNFKSTIAVEIDKNNARRQHRQASASSADHQQDARRSSCLHDAHPRRRRYLYYVTNERNDLESSIYTYILVNVC